jgi:hypothetical protein
MPINIYFYYYWTIYIYTNTPINMIRNLALHLATAYEFQ